MSALTDALQHPNRSLVFLLEITAGFEATGWVLQTGSTYKVTCAYDVASVAWNLTTALTSQTSIANVDANPGSYYADATNGILYVRAPSGNIYDGTVQALVRFYFSNKPKVFNNTFYEPRIKTVPNLSIRIENKFSGVGQFGSGNATLINDDGYFDPLDGLQWDAGTATFRLGADVPNGTAMAYEKYNIIGTWRVTTTENKDDTFTLGFRELKSALEKKIPFETYSFDSYPLTARDNWGKPIPIAYGKIFGAKPTLIDPGLRKFKVAGHAIYNLDEIRVNSGTFWHVVNPASVDLANGEFTLSASDYTGTQEVSVDFYGKKKADGSLMDNAADIIQDLLTYLGETAIDAATLAASRAALVVGKYDDGRERNLFKPAIYLNEIKAASEALSKINQAASAFIFTDLSGQWHWEVFEPLAGDNSSVATFTQNDIVTGSYDWNTDSSKNVSRVLAKFNQRRVENWFETYDLSRDANQFLHNQTTDATAEVEVALWDEKDVRHWAQRYLTTEAQPLTKVSFTIPWQAIFTMPGDSIHITYTRRGMDKILEVIESKQDLIAGKASVVCGNRRAWGDTFGFWMPDATAAWDSGATDSAKVTLKQNGGYWTGDNGLAVASDGKSYQPGRWW